MAIKAGPEFVVLEPIEEQVSEGGIILVEQATRQLRTGRVVSVGSDYEWEKWDSEANKRTGEIERAFEIGSVVIYSTLAGEEFTHGGKKYVVLRGKEIRAMLS